MFTINIYLRFALIALFLIGGVICAFAIGFWWALPLILVGIVLLVGYVLFGTVQSASQIMQTEDFEGAEQRLALTLKPEWLYSTNRAYYYMLKGSMAANRKDNDEAEIWLKKAEAIEIPTDNEKAVVQVQLAGLALNKGRWQQAETYMRTIRELKITEPMVKAQVLQLEQALKQKGQMKAAQRMGGGRGNYMRQGGGRSKRRRPKMR